MFASLLHFSINVAYGKPDSTYFTLFETEQYVLKGTIDSILFSSKCPCLLNVVKENKCVLVKINLDSIIFNGDTIAFQKDYLLNISYMVMPFDRFIPTQKEIIFTASNTSSLNYLQFSRFLDMESNGYIYLDGHFIGLLNCYKLSPKQKIMNLFKRHPYVEKEFVNFNNDEFEIFIESSNSLEQ